MGKNISFQNDYACIKYEEFFITIIFLHPVSCFNAKFYYLKNTIVTRFQGHLKKVKVQVFFQKKNIMLWCVCQCIV